MLSFRLKKQTSENAADTTFNYIVFTTIMKSKLKKISTPKQLLSRDDTQTKEGITFVEIIAWFRVQLTINLTNGN